MADQKSKLTEKRINITVPRDVHARAQLTASALRIGVGDFATSALEAAIAANAKRAAKTAMATAAELTTPTT